MKRILALIIFFALNGCTTTDANLAGPPFTLEEQKILELPENQIDIGIAALTFAKEIYPDTDVEAYSAMIDALVKNVRMLTLRQPKQDPDTQIRVLNTYLYHVVGFRYDHSTQAREKQENYFLPNILDTRIGMCVNMPMLYMAVAQRLGYPIYMVGAPEHFFLKYTGEGLDQPNIEATTGGGYASDAKYIYDFNISKAGIESGAYLRPMTNREFLGILVMQNAIVFAKRMETDKAIAYLEKAIELNPREPLFYRNLAFRYMIKGKYVKSVAEAREYGKIISYNFAKSDELGFVADPDANTRRKQ